MSGTPRGKFPKTAHLLKHADFQRVYERGKRHFSGILTAFYLRRPADSSASDAPVRIGLTVSRALGGSVERNRIRRRVREAVRFHLPALDGLAESVDVVINPKKSVLKVEFAVLSEEIARALSVVRQRSERTTRVSTTSDGNQSK